MPAIDLPKQIKTPPEASAADLSGLALFKRQGLDVVERSVGTLTDPAQLSLAGVGNEALLQRRVVAALEAAGLVVQRETVIGPRERIDLMLGGGVALELKWRPFVFADVWNQLRRYAACASVRRLILATHPRDTPRFRKLTCGGKPLVILPLLTPNPKSIAATGK